MLDGAPCGGGQETGGHLRRRAASLARTVRELLLLDQIIQNQAKPTKTPKVDGVFLEIGLSPNTEPVTELIKLNERDEVPVNPDGSTGLPGLFAAGDVTDVAEKQISVAVGDGALAALTAYKYLVDNNLVIKKPGIGDDWL